MTIVTIENILNSGVVTMDFGPAPSVQDIHTKIIENMDLELGSFYLVYNGKLLNESSCVNFAEDLPVYVIPRILGGKGGFGSMLRAIGAQIEKTTNRDACRDLSGRRLRDINEEQRLKRWFAKQKQRDEEEAELKKKKLERLRQICEGPALPKMEDKEYNRVRAEMSDAVFEAVEKGFEPPSTSKASASKSDAPSTSSSGSSDEAERIVNSEGAEKPDVDTGNPTPKETSAKEPKRKMPTFKKTMLDEDLDSDVSSSDSETEEAPAKKIKIAN